MSRKLALCALVVLLVAGISLAGEKGKEGSWSGVVTDNHCGYQAKHSAECIHKCVKDKGAKYALVDTTTKKVYVLDPQDKAVDHANHTVKVTGTMEGDTIKIKNLEMVPAK